MIAHELGHAISKKADGSGSTNVDYDADLECDIGFDCCTPAYDASMHKMNSKEYQSAAAVEGIAHFYSAVAYNEDVTQTNCEMEKHYQLDWDADGVEDDGFSFSCEGAPVSGLGLSAHDYFGDKCAFVHTANRGTEYDQARMWWDLRTDEGFSVSTIMAIWDAANPHSWNATGDGSGTGYPADRLHDAAFTVGGSSMQTDFDTWASLNGADR